MAHPLDNPIWETLNSNHANLAIAEGGARRFPAEVAPFLAVGAGSVEDERDLARLVRSGEHVCILSVAPEFSSSWTVTDEIDIAQMICSGRLALGDEDEEIVELGVEDRAKMLELTALVYPHYFRAETAGLGAYFGILEEGRLCAMAGIRMALPGFEEISAVCTHPDYRGRGFAKRVTTHLVRSIRARGNTPFLHTEADNFQARALYEKVGFEVRATLPFWVLDRDCG